MPQLEVIKPISIDLSTDQGRQDFDFHLQALYDAINDFFRDAQEEGVIPFLSTDGLSDDLADNGGVAKTRRTTTADEISETQYLDRVTTTDATATTLTTIAITASRTYLIEAHVSARVTSGTSLDSGAGYVVRGAYKTISGTVTIIGGVKQDFVQEDVPGWNATLVISGTNVIVQVTGAAATNLVWTGITKVQYAGT